jgi:hypothetical protein
MNHIDKNIVKELARDLIEELKEGLDDLIYHGWLEQAVRLRVGKEAPVSLYVKTVLEEMLKSGEVEIGTEIRGDHGHVKYIAWSGTVEERVARALEQVERWSGPEFHPAWKSCAYWLCLRKNIDGYEGEGPIVGVDEPKID